MHPLISLGPSSCDTSVFPNLHTALGYTDPSCCTTDSNHPPRPVSLPGGFTGASSNFDFAYACPEDSPVRTGLLVSGMQQEELSGLFARNLTFNPIPEPEPDSHKHGGEERSRSEPPITYITQHYHHSSHLAAKPPPTQRHEPPEALFDIQTVFVRNNINPSLLFPSQIKLFHDADDDQKLRLLEIWRISPPDYGGHALAAELGTWPQTSLQQEEMMAKLRTSRRLQQDSQDENDYRAMTDRAYSHDHATEQLRSIQSLAESSLGCVAEPYVISGYETLSRRDYEQQENALRESQHMYNQAVDPVFRGPSLWQRSASMHQLGTFEQSRGHDASNGVQGRNGQVDDEMAM